MATSNVSVAEGVRKYELDPAHTSAHFSVRHMMISNVRGEFAKVTGAVVYDPAKPQRSSIEAVIAADSIQTREPQRDAHLKSVDFFDAERYPEIRFKSKKVEPLGNSEYRVTGDLTIHGVTREVTLRVEGSGEELTDPWGNLRTGATATAKINRKDFGLAYNQILETGGLLIGDEISITIDAELVRQKG